MTEFVNTIDPGILLNLMAFAVMSVICIGAAIWDCIKDKQ